MKNRLFGSLNLMAALLFSTVLTSWRAEAGGTWALLNGGSSDSQSALLLSDGTVIGFDGGSGCWQLTPDNKGSYTNGTWKQLPSMHDSRLFFSSQVLTNGNVYVAGGEYGTGGGRAEVYDPVTGVWTMAPSVFTNSSFPPNIGIGDSCSEILNNGDVLQYFGPCAGNYSAISNNWYNPLSCDGFGEGAWVKLGDGSILGITDGIYGTNDNGADGAQRYFPSLNRWVADAQFSLNNDPWQGSEMGAAFLLPNGKVFVTGAPTNTAIYTPSALGGTNAGSWAVGPVPLGGNGDGAAAAMANGNVIIGSSGGWCEYNWSNNTIAAIPDAPAGGFGTLDLPDGSVLTVGGNTYAVYFPSTPPLASGQPIISNFTQNADGSYHLTGSKLNGINEGAVGGVDDIQAGSNYPLVRMTNNSSGNVYYARTYNWNKTGVLVASNEATTVQFALPPNLAVGTYSLIVVANGNPSAPRTFTYSPPSAPTGLNAAIGNNQLTLSWNPVSGATAYSVMRSVINGGTPYYAIVATVTGTSYTNTGLVNGQTYYYVVTALGSGGPSGYSAQLAVAPSGPPPTPNGLTATPFSARQINLSWNGSLGAMSYNILRSTTSGSGYVTVGGSYSTNYVDAGLTAGTTYYYVISAAGPNGTSANSGQASGTVVGGNEVNDADPSIAYTGSWTYNPGPDQTSFDGDEHYTGTIGDSCSFTFTGTGIDYVAETYLDEGNVTVYIDGVSNATVSCVSSTRLFQQTVYSNHSLSSGTHTIKLVMASGSFMIVDALVYYPPNTLAQAPTGLNASAGLNQVSLKWHSSVGASSYDVKRSTVSGGPYTFAGNSTTTNYTDATAVGGTKYYYVVTSVDAGGQSANSSQINATALSGVEYNDTYPSIAYSGADWGYSGGRGAGDYDDDVHYAQTVGESASFTFTGTSISYVTEKNSDEGNVTIYIDSVSNATVNCVSATQLSQQTVYSKTNLSAGTHTIKIVMASGTYMLLDAFAAVPSGPPAPTGLKVTAGNTQVALAWNASSGATGYNIKRSTMNGGPYTIIASSTVTNYTDTGLANGATYYYVVSAVNSVAEGANSSQVSTMPVSAYEAAVLSNHPIGYWPLDLTIDTNGFATDFSGNNNNGTYTNISAANEVAGPSAGVPNAVNFDGATQWINLATGGNTNLLNFGGHITMEAWVQPANQSTWGDILAKGYDVGQNWNELEIRADGGDWHGGTYNNTVGDQGPSGGIETTSWTHLACTYDGANWNLYTNGALCATASDPVGALNFADPWAIGTGTMDGANRYFGGNICQVALYTNALTALQISNHYAAAISGMLPGSQSIITTSWPQLTGSWGGGFNLQFQGSNGQNYVVETSTNLVDWTPIFTNVPNNGLFIFTDTNANNPQQFYRVRQ